MLRGNHRPKLLDLFCGAGGAGMGYHRAGFEVHGVDILYQKNYPFRFFRGDAFDFLRTHHREYDVIHASQPCQAFTRLKTLGSYSHPDLLTPIRALLKEIGKPYVIENVPGAPMRGRGITLCGSMFRAITMDGSGQLRRHRHFESVLSLSLPATCNHCLPAVPCFGGGGTQRGRSVHRFFEHHRKEAMGIDWMSRHELSQAIPPIYTEYIGKILLYQLLINNEPRIQSGKMCS